MTYYVSFGFNLVGWFTSASALLILMRCVGILNYRSGPPCALAALLLTGPNDSTTYGLMQVWLCAVLYNYLFRCPSHRASLPPTRPKSLFIKSLRLPLCVPDSETVVW